MQIDNSTAIVDNDFINHLVGSRLADDLLVRALLDIFNSLSLVAAIHPLVYDKELFPQTDRIKLLFQKEVIRRLTFDDAFEQDSDKALARSIRYRCVLFATAAFSFRMIVILSD